MEKNYDDKLGLEDKINECKARIYNLDDGIANKKLILLLHPFIGPALSRLLQYGMGVEDIIGIHNLVQNCKGNTFSFDREGETDRESSKYTDNNDNYNRLYCLTPLADELKKYGSIKLALKEQSEKLDKLSKEIDGLEKQKQDLLAYFKGARYAINTANSMMVVHSKKILDNFAEYVKGKINVIYFLYLPLHVHLIRHSPVFKRKDKKGKKHIKKGKGRLKDQGITL